MNTRAQADAMRGTVALAACLLLAATSAAILFHYILAGFYLDLDWPTNSLGEGAQFVANDLTRLLAVSRDLDPWNTLRTHIPHEPAPYGPLAFVFFWALSALPGSAGIWMYHLVAAAGIVLAVRMCATSFPHPQNWLVGSILTVASYPVLYAFDRGNLDLLILPLLIFAVLDLKTRRNRTRAAILIGIASALKLYPAIFFALFLADRDFRNLAIGVASAAVLSLTAAFALSGGILASVSGLLSELAMTRRCFASVEACASLSLAMSFKTTIAELFGSDVLAGHTDIVAAAYTLLSLVMVVLTTVFVAFVRPPFHYTLTLLVSMAVLLPAMSFHYKLILYFLPLSFLLRRLPTPGALASTLVIFALLVPKKLFGAVPAYAVDVALIAALCAVCVVTPLRSVSAWCRPPARYLQGAVFACGAVLLLSYAIAAGRLLLLPSFDETGGEIVFARSDPAGHFGKGWGPFETDRYNTWRWMHGHDAALWVRLEPARGWAVHATVNNHPGNTDQTVQMLVDGVSAGVVNAPAGQVSELVFHIEDDLPPVTFLNRRKIEIHVRQANTPPGTRGTRLGVSFTNLRFERVAR